MVNLWYFFKGYANIIFIDIYDIITNISHFKFQNKMEYKICLFYKTLDYCLDNSKRGTKTHTFKFDLYFNLKQNLN